jgi:hypothetical protein
MTGQVNFIEAPAPDTIDRLKSAGMQIVTNKYRNSTGPERGGLGMLVLWRHERGGVRF